MVLSTYNCQVISLQFKLYCAYPYLDIVTHQLTQNWLIYIIVKIFKDRGFFIFYLVLYFFLIFYCKNNLIVTE